MYDVEGVKVSPQSWEYLKLQRGDLKHLIPQPKEWFDHYGNYIHRTMKHIKSALPFAGITSALDIGSGLGVSDVLLHRMTGAHISLLDGEDAPAKVIRQDQPFLARGIIEQFMADNDVSEYVYLSPRNKDGQDKTYDLIMSFGSWCFHYPPAWYLDFVLNSCHDNTRLIVDLRKQRPLWHVDMAKHFRMLYAINADEKWERTVWELK